MSFGINDTRRIAQSDIQEVISQWRYYDLDYWLRVERQITNVDSFDDLFNTSSLNVRLELLQTWLTDNQKLQIGLLPGTSLEQYRNIEIRNVSMYEMLKGFPFKNFPLSMVKPGTNIPMNLNNPDAFDKGILRNVEFRSQDIINLWAYFAVLENITFYDCNVLFAFMEKAKKKGWIAENTDFKYCVFSEDDQTLHPLRDELLSSTFRNCSFEGCFMDGLFSDNTTLFENCTFAFCRMLINHNYNQYSFGVLNNCVFTNCAITPVYRKVNNCVFQNCVITSEFSSIIIDEATNVDFSSSAFGGSMFGGQVIIGKKLANCNLSNCQFFWGANIATQCDVRGTNFYNSNFPLWAGFTTKAAFRNHVIHDQTTIWIDGTPLTED